MIEPIVGDIVHYRPPYLHEAPLAAIVAGVHTTRSVNLFVIHDDGSTFPALEVALLQDDDSAPADQPYAEWMPFQKGQAPASSAVTEQLGKLEARLGPIEDVIKTGGPIYQIVTRTQEMVEQVHQRVLALEQAGAPKPPEQAPPEGRQSDTATT